MTYEGQEEERTHSLLFVLMVLVRSLSSTDSKSASEDASANLTG